MTDIKAALKQILHTEGEIVASVLRAHTAPRSDADRRLDEHEDRVEAHTQWLEELDADGRLIDLADGKQLAVYADGGELVVDLDGETILRLGLRNAAELIAAAMKVLAKEVKAT